MIKKITGVICFGDSILAGTGASDREFGCSKLLKSSLQVPVSLKGRNWETSTNALERLETDVLNQKSYSHILILFGNNDCWLVSSNKPKVNIELFTNSMLKIANKIIANNQVPIFCNLQPIDSNRFSKMFPELEEFRKQMKEDAAAYQKRYSDQIEKIAKSSNSLFVDIRKNLVEVNNLEEIIAADGIHPNNKGHYLIAETILSFLNQIDPSLDILKSPPPK